MLDDSSSYETLLTESDTEKLEVNKDTKKIISNLDKIDDKIGSKNPIVKHVTKFIRKLFLKDSSDLVEGIKFLNIDKDISFLENELKDDELDDDPIIITKKGMNVKQELDSSRISNIIQGLFDSSSIIAGGASSIITNMNDNLIISEGSKNIFSGNEKEEVSANFLSYFFYSNSVKGNYLNTDDELFLTSLLVPMIKFDLKTILKDNSALSIVISIQSLFSDQSLLKFYLKTIFSISKKIELGDYVFKDNNWNSFINSLEYNETMRRYFSINIIKYIPKKIIKKSGLKVDEFIFYFIIFRKTYKHIINELYKKNKKDTSRNLFWSIEQEKNCILLFYSFIKLKDFDDIKQLYITSEENAVSNSFVESVINKANKRKLKNSINTSIKTILFEAKSHPIFEKFFKNWYTSVLSNIILEKKKLYNTPKNFTLYCTEIFSIFFSRLVCLNFITTCNDRGNIVWYKFNGIYLEESNVGDVLSFIKENYIKSLDQYVLFLDGELKYLNSYINQSIKRGSKNTLFLTEDKSDKNILRTEINNFIKSYSHSTSTFSKEFLSQISTNKYIFNKNLIKVLNKNPCLIAFKNCVVELNNKGAIQRKGKIEDHITKVCGIELKYNKKYVAQAYSYLQTVFPVRDVYDFMLLRFASYLFRGNIEKFLEIWIGSGYNSKSILVKIFQKIFGQNYCIIPCEQLSVNSSHKDGGKANSDLSQSEDTNVAFYLEPSSTFKMDVGSIKAETGGDTRKVRNLFENSRELIASYKAILCCNNPPEIEGTCDYAFRERILYIPFESTWSSAAPISKEEQSRLHIYPLDENFAKNIPIIASGLAWIMFENYKNYKEKKTIKLPSYISNKVEDYWNAINIYKNFFSQCIIKEEDEFLTPQKALSEFQIFWSKNSVGKINSLTLSKFKVNLNPILGECKKFTIIEKEGGLLKLKKTAREAMKFYNSDEAWIGYKIYEEEE